MVKQVLDLVKSYILTPKYLWENVKWRYPTTISDLNVIFIIGAPRSGTTLLQKILSSHTGLFSIQDETGIFSYQNIFDLKRKHFGLSDQEQLRLFKESKDIIDFFERGVKMIPHEHNQMFVEKTPQHIMYLKFLMKHFPNAKFIHIVRDGRDCYCSAKNHPTMPQNTSLKQYAKYWKKCVLNVIENQNSNLLTITYENLSSFPKESVTKIMKFLNLKFEEHQLDSNMYKDDPRAKLSQFQKLNSKIEPSSVNRWEKELSDEEKKDFLYLARNELLYFKYAEK